MKRKRLSEEQIIGILKQAEAGAKVEDLCRQHGMAPGTAYAWRNNFRDMEVNEAKRLRGIEDDNRKLKNPVADLSLDNQMLEAVNAKNGKPWKALCRGTVASGRVSNQRASRICSCRLPPFNTAL